MNRQIQCLVGHKTFQSPVFLLQFLEAPSLIHLHTTVLLPPPVVGLFADAKLTNRLSDRLALTGPYLCLTKVSDNLLSGKNEKETIKKKEEDKKRLIYEEFK